MLPQALRCRLSNASFSPPLDLAAPAGSLVESFRLAAGSDAQSDPILLVICRQQLGSYRQITRNDFEESFWIRKDFTLIFQGELTSDSFRAACRMLLAGLLSRKEARKEAGTGWW